MRRVVVLEGNLDSQSLRGRRADFEALAECESSLALDMGSVRVMDGAGLGALAYIGKRLRACGHKMTLLNVSGQPLNFLAKFGLEDTLIEPTVMPPAARGEGMRQSRPAAGTFTNMVRRLVQE